MALDSVLLTRRRYLAYDLETTTGTAVSLAASNAGTIIFDPKFTPQSEIVARQRPGGFGYIAGVPGALATQVTFRHDIYWGATGQPDWYKLWRCCGFTQSSDMLTAAATSTDTLTIGGYVAGRKHLVSGAAGNIVVTATNGQPCVAEYTFTGLRNTPTDTSLLSPTLDTGLPPRCASATVTIGGVAYRFPEWKLDLGNVVVLREDHSSASGYRSAWVTDRTPTLTVVPEASLLATKDWYSAFMASTEAAFSAQIGSTTNNIFTFAATKLQLARDPEETDRNGVVADSLTFNLNEDNLTLTLS